MPARRFAALMTALLLTPASAAQAQIGIVSLIDKGIKVNPQVYRNRGLIEVIDLAQLRTWRSNTCAIGTPTSGNCPVYEYSVPFLTDPAQPLRSSLDVSRDVAGVMQYEWQRFQDRTRWAISMDLNKSLSVIAALAPVPYDTRAMNCTPGLNVTGDLAIQAARIASGTPPDILAAAADYALSVPSDSTHASFKLPSGLTYGMADDGVALPSYPYPRIDRAAYCTGRETPSLLLDSLYPVPGTVYLPNTSVYGFSLPGSHYPLPLAFDWNEVRRRIRASCNTAVKTYYAEYLKNVTQAVATKMPEAMHWNGYTQWHGNRSGVIFAPVAAGVPNAPAVLSLASRAQTPQLLAYLTGNTKLAQTVINQTRVNNKLIQLEDLKRWLRVGNTVDAEQQGAVQLFETWQALEPVVDGRPLVYFANANSCTLTGCTPVPVPMPMPDTVISPAGCSVSPTNGGLGTLTYSLPRAHFAWVSVPEGFPIPGLSGDPVLRVPQ